MKYARLGLIFISLAATVTTHAQQAPVTPPSISPSPSPSPSAEPRTPPKTNPNPKTKAAQKSSPLATPQGSDRIVNHKEAYKDKIKDEHINVKVTPAEKRGKPGYVLVEVYNRSNFALAGIEFNIEFASDSWLKFDADLSFGDMVPNWSDARWIKIPGEGKMPAVTKITITKKQTFAKVPGGIKEITLPWESDLIKE